MPRHEALAAALDTSGPRVALRDPIAVRQGIEDIARLAVFGAPQERTLARYAIHAAAPALGAVPSSIAALYAARGRGEIGGFTVPAVNIRGMAYDMARALFRAMLATGAAASVFELARSEVAFTHQQPAETAAAVLAAAIAEGYQGPIFLQGDHYQVDARRFAADPEGELRDIEDLVRKAVAAQFYCIDIDASTIVDLARERVADQQAPNASVTARLAQLLRALQPQGVAISIGGEIGEVGAHNTTVEELHAYLDQFRRLVGPEFEGLSKVSVQTGTTHGGIPLPDGGVATVALDFETLREISHVCRESYGMAGAVQHGASTLPDDLFHRFPEAETAEVHLATGFQNLILDHPAFPPDLLDRMRRYCERELAAERAPAETDSQFFYRTRRKVWGPFKRETWDLPPDTRALLRRDLQAKFEFLIRQLRADNSREMTLSYVTHPPVEVEPPASHGV